MNKQEFLTRLQEGLKGLPADDVKERMMFYEEMIDDRMEDGISEEDAVSMIGPVDEVVSQIISEIPLQRIVKERISPNRSLKTWEIVLLILGFPLWFPLIVTFFVLVLTIYIVIWSLVISVWAVELAFIVSVVALIPMGIVLLSTGRTAQGLILLCMAAVLAGFAILLYFGCVAAGKGAVVLGKKLWIGVKSMFIRKEKA